LEPHSDLAATSSIAAPATPDLVEQTKSNEELSVPQTSPAPHWWDGTGLEIVRTTRTWIQYGTVAFAVVCIVIGAVEALFGR
jgi:hypothetical protein